MSATRDYHVDAIDYATDAGAVHQVRDVVFVQEQQVPRELEPFARLREVVDALAQAMDGVITDDAGQPLKAQTIDAIGADLDRLYDALEQHDLAAGSPQARRLFS